jgi:hypothetical protein
VLLDSGKQTPANAQRVGWKRSVEADITRLKTEYKADVLVSLLDPHEYKLYKMVSAELAS